MGAYTYVNDYDLERMRTVSDKELNEVLAETLLLDSTVLISEYCSVKERFFRKPKISYWYQVYHEEPGFDGRPYQARVMICACGDKRVVMTYLFGIINGVLNERNKKQL